MFPQLKALGYIWGRFKRRKTGGTHVQRAIDGGPQLGLPIKGNLLKERRKNQAKKAIRQMHGEHRVVQSPCLPSLSPVLGGSKPVVSLC